MKITDEMLYQHAAEARDIWLDTLPKDDELPEHQFSDEFMASFESMKKQEKVQQKKKRRTPLQRVAAVFLAILIGSGTWLGVDAEARAAFVSWFREPFIPMWVKSLKRTLPIIIAHGCRLA